MGEAKELTDMALDELFEAAYSCTGCRRCMVYCPFGIDTQQLMSIAKLLLIGASAEPEILTLLADTSIEKGKSLDLFKEGFLEGIKRLEADVVEKWQTQAGTTAIPIDVEGADLLYVALAGAHSIIPAAAVFNAAGENWTMPSEGWDMTNFGLFSGDDDLGGAVARRLYEKTAELRGKKLVMSECGHGYRSSRCEGPNWAKFDVPFDMESSVSTMLRYVKEGRIKVDKTRNTEPVTFHDSCNNARSCGLFEEPRELLDLVVTDFREMYPNRTENYCCTGGGGAMSMSEYTPRRLKSAKIKADQLKATGAK